VDIRGSKGEREVKDHMKKNRREERNKTGWMSWNEAKTAAQDGEGWVKNVKALCPSWLEETRG